MSGTLAALCASLAVSVLPASRTCYIVPAPRPVAAVAAPNVRMVAPAAKPRATSPAAAPQLHAAPAAPASTVAKPKPAPAQQAVAKAPATAVKPKPPTVDKAELHPVEANVIERTNAERARYGLRPFIIDRLLMGQARRHAAWMTQARVMQHSAGAAENIAMGQRSSDEVVRTWMNSSGHRANILNAGYNRLGVAAYTTPEGTVFWCQQFRP